jgi:hypothetical protein
MLDAALDELYATPPERFTQRRAEWVARLRGKEATALKRRRRPTRDAFALNLLARAGGLERLARLGKRFTAALRKRDGEALRATMTEEREIVTELTERALALAAEKGVHADPRAVSAALRAAIADPDVAEAVAEGRLERAPAPVSFPAFS